MFPKLFGIMCACLHLTSFKRAVVKYVTRQSTSFIKVGVVNIDICISSHLLTWAINKQLFGLLVPYCYLKTVRVLRS